jgi:hypothetical protein
VQGDLIAPIVGDIHPCIDSFRQHLRAANVSPRTIETYLEAATQLAAFHTAHGMPTQVNHLRRATSRIA